MNNKNALTIYTIGHSTRDLDGFIAILNHYGIQQVIDVRTVPRSRTNPQYNSDALEQSLKKEGIAYIHMAGLGGFRHTSAQSINTAWHNASFRGYADYMQTDAFAQNLELLITYATNKKTVIMCAEAVPWRCHRSLIADALLIRHINVLDIFSLTNVREHKRTPWSRIKKGAVYYPGLR